MKKFQNRKRKLPGRGENVLALVEQVFEKYGQSDVLDEVKGKVESDVAAPKGRKQRRRDLKQLKKQKKQKHFERKSKKSSHEIGAEVVDSNASVVPEIPAKKPKTPKLSPRESRKKTLMVANEKEDKTITSLEKKLFLNKRKGKKKLPKSFVDAGLDYILDVLDNPENIEEDSDDDLLSSKLKASGKDVNKDVDSDIDLEEVNEDSDDDFFMSKAKASRKDASNDEDLDEEENLFHINNNEEDLEDSESIYDAEEDDHDADSDMTDEDVQSNASFEEEDVSASNDATGSYDIEESTQTETVQAVGKYVPPALRVKLSDEQNENKIKLKRKIKGLFNRLSDSNLNGICGDIENLYRTNSRALMNEVFTEIVMDQFSVPDPAPDSLIMETAMLISVLGARVAVEVIMHFYEVTSMALHTLLSSQENESNKHGKAINNLIKLLGCLYQLRTIDHRIIVDFFKLLVASFTEKDIEVMLDLLNSVGFQLRKDDPESLRDLIKEVMLKCSEHNVDVTDGSRMSYMVNVLMAVKNNNVRKVTGYDPSATTARRKKLSTLIKNSNENAHLDVLPPITLKDFIDADAGGRWWIVGSSFMGRPMLRDQNQDTESMEEIDMSVSKKVVQAARMQRMNTDVRRKIFYAVMTADDFVDAFEKVIKCGLKGKQLREVANVIVDCCQQEKKFNPYYLHLLNRFCQHDRQFSISLQCTIWDRFKVLHSLKRSQMNNIVELLSNLILLDAISLSCLKAINFAEIDQTMVQFLRSLLCTIADHTTDIEQLKTIFDRLTSKHKMVRQGLNLFLQHFILADEEYMKEHSSLRNSFKEMFSFVRAYNKTYL